MLLDPSRVVAASLRVLPRKRLSRALGELSRLRPPQPWLREAMRLYVQAYGVDLSEAEVPAAGFDSFDAFFTRRLKQGARTLDPDPDAVISPADGRIEAAGTLEAGATFRVKGSLYTAADLLEDVSLAARFDGGTYAIVYLSPKDYHRVHVPVDGRILSARHIGGTLFPVNAIGVRHISKLFARNERVVIVHDTSRHGTVASVMVGAIGVGRISVSFDNELVTNNGRPAGLRSYGVSGPELTRGAEMGVFHLGSTVVLFLEPGLGLRLAKQAGDRVRMGEALARKHSG